MEVDWQAVGVQADRQEAVCGCRSRDADAGGPVTPWCCSRLPCPHTGGEESSRSSVIQGAGRSEVRVVHHSFRNLSHQSGFVTPTADSMQTSPGDERGGRGALSPRKGKNTACTGQCTSADHKRSTPSERRLQKWTGSTHGTDEGEVEERAKDGYSSDKTNGNWEEAPRRENTHTHTSVLTKSSTDLILMKFTSPEQEEEAVDLQHNSNNGPTNQDHEHASEEETGGFHLVLLKEEAKRPFQPDDKGQSSNEEYLQEEKKNELLQEPRHGPSTKLQEGSGSYRAIGTFSDPLFQFQIPGFATTGLWSSYSCLRLNGDHLWPDGPPASLS